MLKQVEQRQLNAWVDSVIGKQAVFGIQAKDDRFAFGPLARAADLRLDYDVSILSPKKYFQPVADTLVRFSRAANCYEAVVEEEPFVVFGVHPYDVVAISQMDAVFSADNEDVHYLSRRRNATIVACDIQNASQNVFASCMGTATVQEGFDVLLTKIGDRYAVEARTAKGEAVMAGLGRAPEAEATTLARREQFWEDAGRLFVRHKLNCGPGDLPELLAHSHDHPVWAERAKLCFSCGQCTMVCPTCYCFNVEDEVSWGLDAGERVRRWDSCQLAGFAEVAGGHNFRRRTEDRYRHRFYRKGKYLWDRLNQIACVGCGRCTTACPAKIANPVEVYNALLEDR